MFGFRFFLRCQRLSVDYNWEKSWAGKLFKFKSWEVQICRTKDILGFEVEFSTRRDHAGLYVMGSLFSYEVEFNVYDNRHWNTDLDCWNEGQH